MGPDSARCGCDNRCGTLFGHRHCGWRAHRPRHHIKLCSGRTVLRFGRFVLCRVRLHDTRGRIGLHLFILYYGRARCLDNRVGPRARICPGRHDCQHIMEPLFHHHVERPRVAPATSLDSLSGRWRRVQSASHIAHCAAVVHTDARHQGQFKVQRFSCRVKDSRSAHFHIRWFQIHQHRQPDPLCAAKHRCVWRIRLVGRIAWCRHCVLCLLRFRRHQHRRTGNPKSASQHAHRHIGFAAHLHPALHGVCPCHDRCG